MSEREHICTPNCFRIYRDGKWLATRVCMKVLSEEMRAEHRRLKARKKMWRGEPKR